MNETAADGPGPAGGIAPRRGRRARMTAVRAGVLVVAVLAGLGGALLRTGQTGRWNPGEKKVQIRFREFRTGPGGQRVAWLSLSNLWNGTVLVSDYAAVHYESNRAPASPALVGVPSPNLLRAGETRIVGIPAPTGSGAVFYELFVRRWKGKPLERFDEAWEWARQRGLRLPERREFSVAEGGWVVDRGAEARPDPGAGRGAP